MISVSGIRGRIPSGLNIDNIVVFSKAFAGVIQGKKVVLARDSRPSGQFIESIATGVLLAYGIDVMSLGIVPTPTLKAVVNATGSAGGVMISASHNPIEWNAFKFVGKNGFFFDQNQIDSLLSLVENKDFKEPYFNPRSQVINSPNEHIQLHIDAVLKQVDVNKIKKSKFKVYIDAVNGAGSYVVPELLKRLGCIVYEKYCKPDGKFPRSPEPTKDSLKGSSKFMKSSGADIGFALDPDADRLVLISKTKGSISEEYTLPLSIQSVLPFTQKTNVVINLSSSSMTEEVISPYNKKLFRSKVGEANVVQTMLQKKAFFGGEGNGGVIDPQINSYGRDSLSGIAHILNYLAREKLSLEQAIDKIPPYFMKKVSFPIQGKDIRSIIQKLKDHYASFPLDETDGLRIQFDSSWLHIRPSNTEPIIRIIGEAPKASDLEILLSQTTSIIEKC
ncbi:MAG: phosphoglucosamine mutase [Leptospiraceae bacterium]|nr:phosphoglucosamine mutase [Leptospiraceae bacterium]MCP5496443.1 phosphoglucosamine mutase [Leptospiraceae bacterium]